MGENSYIGKAQIGIYGLGNFASQLSWTMVSTYLIIFYTDTAGLTTGAVAVLMLVARIWDGINDPVMGMLMDRTRSRWGRFRPYILFGAPLLVVFTVLTFTVPKAGPAGSLLYAYITYIGLGMSYTVVNVPYTALPAVMTRDANQVNRLYTAQMIGMTTGMIVLNLITLPLVEYFNKGGGNQGYQRTAAIFAVVSLPLFWLVAGICKERVMPLKEKAASLKQTWQAVTGNKNLLAVVSYVVISMTGMLGRIGVAVYFYLYCVRDLRFITVFMMMQMVVGTVIMPFAPRIIRRFGKKRTCMIAMLVQALGTAMMFLGPYQNIPYLFFCHIVYGIGYIAGPCGSAMTIAAVNDYADRYGTRIDGTALAMNSLGTKIASAIGSALCIAVIGWFGYMPGTEPAGQVKLGINIAANLIPMALYLAAIIPLSFYDIET